MSFPRISLSVLALALIAVTTGMVGLEVEHDHGTFTMIEANGDHALTNLAVLTGHSSLDSNTDAVGGNPTTMAPDCPGATFGAICGAHQDWPCPSYHWLTRKFTIRWIVTCDEYANAQVCGLNESC